MVFDKVIKNEVSVPKKYFKSIYFKFFVHLERTSIPKRVTEVTAKAKTPAMIARKLVFRFSSPAVKAVVNP